MSFAGPYDPMLQLALKKAHDKSIVLIAAAGNAGPRSQPLYPAADENVIAVTAIDANNRLLPQANQGPYIALAAPGVSILEPAANAGYQLTSGTSVAAAHVSGVAALIIERKPDIDFAALEKILFATAKDLGPKGRDSQFGFGLVDPYRALDALADKVAADHPTAAADVGGHGGIRNIPGQPTCSWRRSDTRASQHAARGRRRARQRGEKTPRLPAGGREQRNARSRLAGLRRYLRGGSSLGLPEAGSRAKSPWSGTQRLPQQLPGIVARFLPAFTAWERHPPTSVMTSSGLPLRDLLENAAFGLDANCDKGDGCYQIRESKRIKGPAAEPLSEHKADHRGRQERADAADAEEPADGRGAQMGRVQFADVDAGRAVYAGVDPADQEGCDVSGKTRRHRKRQMEESAHKIVQEQNRAAAIAIDQKTATRIAEEASDRLDQLESNGVRQRYPALGQDRGQHEQN